MTTYYRTKGFVFKKNDRSEADRIFTIFTEDFGKIEIRARAIRKITSKLRGGIDKFCLSEVEFIQGKNHKTLTDAVTVERFNCIAQNIEKLIISNKIAEVLDNFIKGQEKDEKLWNLILGIFEKLNSQQSAPIRHQLLYYYFFWNFFSELGYMPEIQKCAKCHEKLDPCGLYFSNVDGGVICDNCAGKKTEGPEPCRRINSDIVKILRLILKKDWQVLSRLKIESFSQNLLGQISDNYHLYMLSNNSFS
ncbi:MAG: DNA repair protein RecO [Patescibacteria group bacterium]